MTGLRAIRIQCGSMMLLGAYLAFAPGAVSDEVRLTNGREIAWQQLSEPQGGFEARLWGNLDAGAVLLRWPATTKTPERSDQSDTHVIVLVGTLTIEVDGVYRELGPAGFADVPAGKRYKLGCEAAGECMFVVHRPLPADGA